MTPEKSFLEIMTYFDIIILYYNIYVHVYITLHKMYILMLCFHFTRRNREKKMFIRISVHGYILLVFIF